jgi:hypothetical protein
MWKWMLIKNGLPTLGGIIAAAGQGVVLGGYPGLGAVLSAIGLALMGATSKQANQTGTGPATPEGK